jgi:hypothetical protein
MIFLDFSQGSQEWLDSRAGVCTASRFKDARHRVGGLTEQQQAYVDALQSGHSETQALIAGGYKKPPTAANVSRALAGQRVDVPGNAAISYAWTIAMERIAHKPLDETFVTWKMRRGQELEPEARAAYEVRTDYMVLESGLLLTDDKLFGYSTDGFVDDDGMVEIKCPATCDKLGNVWEHPETAHEEYIDQIEGGLWLTGRKWCDLVIYCPWLAPVGKDLFIKRIWRDEDRITALADDLVEFNKLASRCMSVLIDKVKTERYLHPASQNPGAAPVEVAPWVEPTPPKTQAAFAAIAQDLPETIF